MTSIHSSSAAARMLAVCAVGLAFVTNAQAQPSEAQLSAIKSNCRSDYMSNCMSVRPGGKEALQCLQSHLDSLSGACKGAVGATMPPPAAAAPPRAAPPPKAATAPRAKKAITAKHAPAPPPPSVAIAPPPPGPDPAILLAKAERLPVPAKLRIMRACDQDQAAVCPSVRAGGGRLIVCMAMHPDALSPFCRRALAAALQ